MPKFAAVDISRLPPITFDSVDVSVLLNSIKKLEKEGLLLEDSVKTGSQHSKYAERHHFICECAS